MEQVAKNTAIHLRSCDVCGAIGVEGYMYSLSLCWHVTGSAFVPGFMCDQVAGGQHWGCCMEHAVQAVETCLREHMGQARLQQYHDEAHKRPNPEYDPEKPDETPETIQRPRYSDEDAHWAAGRGENFHLARLVFPPGQKG